MRKRMAGMIWIAVACGLFAALPGSAYAAGLTIGDGARVEVINGASISMGCQSVVIEDGGRMYLGFGNTEPGALYKCGKVQVDPGGYLSLGGGKIVHCAVAPQIMLLLLE
ncbi:MAG: hypothetical protein PHI99_05110 [Syntrophales bacterium]|nr:hypothetical protein [Syntrophales bacterium]